MPTIRTTISDPSLIAARRLPRNDVLVAEEEVAPGVFRGVAGPFSTWEREIHTIDGETIGQTALVETLRARLAAPHLGRLMELLLRHPIRHGVPRDTSPWWAPTQRITQRDATILGLCATLSLIAGFLGGLIGQTMAFIAKDLGGDTDVQATAFAIIRVGAVLTFVATALADRRGRRPVLKWTLVGASVAALVTALAPSLTVVTGSQLVCRGLVAASAYLIPIVCSEELPARSRAYAIGLMSLPGALGVGIVLWLLPLINLGPSAWRLLYLFGAVTLIATWKTVARLPESRRFESVDPLAATEPAGFRAKSSAEPESEGERWSGVVISRFLVLALTMVLLNVFAAPVQQMQTDYLSNTRQMGPALIALFMLATNSWGFVGVALGARMADRSSRRLATAIGMVGFAIGNTLLFTFGGPLMWVGSLIGSAVGGLIVPSLGALLPELFPTLRRGAANGLMNGAAVCGSILGLLIVARSVSDGHYAPTVAMLALGPLIVAALVWALPETAGVELEELNPSDSAPDPA